MSPTQWVPGLLLYILSPTQWIPGRLLYTLSPTQGVLGRLLYILSPTQRVQAGCCTHCLLPNKYRPAVGPAQFPIQWEPGPLYLRVKWPWFESDHSSPSHAKPKNSLSNTCPLLHVFVMGFLIVVYVSYCCLCILLLSMYSYCCLCILIVRPCTFIVVYVYLLLPTYS